ncbi:MAG: SUMF1/EgtB/PvdO family nonheme iron enzyme [Myxococcota bacterium]
MSARSSAPTVPAVALGLVALLAFGSACATGEPELVAVPAGSFVMGHDGGPPDQAPAHLVRLEAFAIERTLVTVDAFAAFVAATGYRTTAERRGTGKTAVLGMDDWEWREVAGVSWRAPWGEANAAKIPLAGDMPVTMVSWLDADAYCRWRGRRLPTEAEWEYAMRAGATTRYPWGDDLVAPDGRARMNHWEGRTHHENSAADGWVYLAPTRAYPPNRWGIYDPAGNVWQWVADWYAADTRARRGRPSDRRRRPEGPDAGVFKVARGGSWWCSARTCNGYGLVARARRAPRRRSRTTASAGVADLAQRRWPLTRVVAVAARQSGTSSRARARRTFTSKGLSRMAEVAEAPRLVVGELVAEGGDEDDRHRPARAPDARQDVEAAQEGHAHVGDDEVDGRRRGGRRAARPSGGGARRRCAPR